jgi:hypothetical protein
MNLNRHVRRRYSVTGPPPPRKVIMSRNALGSTNDTHIHETRPWDNVDVMHFYGGNGEDPLLCYASITRCQIRTLHWNDISECDLAKRPIHVRLTTTTSRERVEDCDAVCRYAVVLHNAPCQSSVRLGKEGTGPGLQ